MTFSTLVAIRSKRSLKVAICCGVTSVNEGSRVVTLFEETLPVTTN
jgi:hypothetical protein